MNRLFLLVLLPFFIHPILAQELIPLWPEGKMPNSRGLELQHEEENERITRVAKPGMYAFFTSKDENTGTSVLVCPSGGYHHLTYNLGGIQIAKWLNTLGINAFVLLYRLPTEPDLIEQEKGPIQDAQRAMKIIRSRAEEWDIDPDMVGTYASSSGGHVASTIGTHEEDLSLIGDSLDNYNFRPDFMMLVSPVITMGEFAHEGSLNNLLGESPSKEMVELYSNELHVTVNTPPTFLVHARNDHTVPCQNSLLFYGAMVSHGVPGSLHLFPDGDHSINLRNNPGATNMWPVLCEEWMRQMGFIP